MTNKDLRTIEQVQQFLDGCLAINFHPTNQAERYHEIQTILCRFGYQRRNKKEKGVLRQYLLKITGYSRQQLTRLIKQYKQHKTVKIPARRRYKFPNKYSEQDIALLAKTDSLHNRPNGAMVKKILVREYEVFGHQSFECIANVSVAHIYNLRKTVTYARSHQHYTKTKPKAVSIGERKKPQPEGRPGFIRIDSVHQGDKDKVKGVYHINAVDEVTQFEAIVSVEKISERYMVPALKTLFSSFPFVIKGFHSDNGSEYINGRVANLLKKSLIEFTKSRSRKSNDNALAESKNASIVRKQLGYIHIPQQFALQINEFNRKYLVPYINFHRPCLFPSIKTDAKGKEKKCYLYQHISTPYEKFKSLDNAQDYLREGVNFTELDAIAYQYSDNEFAQQLNEARKRLFEEIFSSAKAA